MNTLRTNFKMTNPESEAYVHANGEQFPVGSMAAHEILKMLKQEGETLTHEFKRLNKEKQIITKAYIFNREHVESFIKENIQNKEWCAVSNEEWAQKLRNGGKK